MSTATQPVPMEASSEVANWVAPRATKGMTVLFYPNGNVNGEPVTSTCLVSKPRTINLVTVATHQGHDGVFHKDDPRAATSEHIRLNGLWDFTDETKKQVKLEKTIEGLVADVEYLKGMMAQFLGENPDRAKKPATK